MVQLPSFRAFVKRADRPAQTRCELEAWSVQLGLEGDPPHVAYIDVAPTHAYETVVRPAARDEQPLQVGLEFADGKRLLLTGKAEVQMPKMIGTQVLERVRMYVERVDRFEHRRRKSLKQRLRPGE